MLRWLLPSRLKARSPKASWEAEVSLEDLGNLGDFIGGIAVIVTLLYLAVQIRQNTRTLQAVSLDSAQDHFARSQIIQAQDKELADLLDRGMSDYSGLDRVDKRRYRSFFIQQLRGLEIIFFKHQQRLLPTTSWEGYERTMDHSFGRPGWQQCWNETRVIFSPEFRELVEGIVRNRSQSGPDVE